MIEHGAVRGHRAFRVGDQSGLELQAIFIGEQQRLLQKQGRARKHRRIAVVGHVIEEVFDQLRRGAQALMRGRQAVVDKDGHGLALQNRFARGVGLVRGDVLAVLSVAVREIVAGLALPLVQIYPLVLESMGQLVRQHRLLRIGGNPVEQVYGLRFAVVVRGNLLVQQLHQKRLQMEVRIDQAELLQHDFRPLHALRIFVVLHFFQEILLDFRSRGQVRFHFVLNSQLGVFRGELKNGRNGGE